MGFDDGTQIIGELLKFAKVRLDEKQSSPLPPCYYDFARADMPEISEAARHFDVVLVDVSFQLFKLMNHAVYGRDLLANLQAMINEDALLLGTTQHVFALDIKPLVWTAKRVEQQRRETVAEKAAAKRSDGAAAAAAATAGYGSTVTLCPTRGAAAARISVAAYVFGLNTALPDAAKTMKSTPELFAKFCVFISDLVANHLQRPHPARQHTIIMSGFVRSTAQKPVVYRQVRTVFLETVVLDELEQRVMATLDTAPPPPPQPPKPQPQPTVEAPETRYAKEQEARAAHVSSEQLTQAETAAPSIGEAEAQIIYFIETLARESEPAATLSFLVRSEDTDCIALALLAVPDLLRAGAEMIEHRLWLDLTHQGTKRLLDVVALWRALMATETRLALHRPNKQPVAHLIEWLVLLMNLGGNDYCERMSHMTPRLLFENAEYLLGLVAGCKTPPLMFCDVTHDMAVREMLLAQFMMHCLETKPAVSGALRRLRLDTTRMHSEQVVREKFAFLAQQLARKPEAGASAHFVSPFHEIEAHLRRATACLHYQRNVARPDYELLNAYALGPDRLPLYGYRQWEQNCLSSRHGYPPPKKTVYEMSRHVTPHSVVRHPFIRRRQLVVQDPPSVVAPPPPPTTTTTTTTTPKSTFDKKRKEFSRDEVESIEDADDDDDVVLASSTAGKIAEAATKRARTIAGSVDDLDPWLMGSNGVIRRPVDPNSGEFGSFIPVVAASNNNNNVKAHSH